MHDFSISRAIGQRVVKEAKAIGAKKVIQIEVEIGELTFLNPQQLTFWLNEFFKGTVVQGSRVLIKKIPARLECRNCDYRGGLSVEEDPSYHYMLPRFSCPCCGSGTIEISRGRECSISRIRVEK